MWLYQRELLWEKKAKGFDFDEFHCNSQILMVGVAVQHVLRARTGTNGAETSILGPGMAGGPGWIQNMTAHSKALSRTIKDQSIRSPNRKVDSIFSSYLSPIPSGFICLFVLFYLFATFKINNRQNGMVKTRSTPQKRIDFLFLINYNK